MSPPPHNPCIPLYSTPQVPVGNLGPISDHAPPTSNDTTASQSTPPREPLDLPPLIHHSSSPRPLNTNDPPLQAGFHDPMFTLQASTQRPHLGPRHRATRHGTRPHQPPRDRRHKTPCKCSRPHDANVPPRPRPHTTSHGCLDPIVLPLATTQHWERKG
jgi:hypothetical protein